MEFVQAKLDYMDSLSKANGSGHKVDNELKEIIQSLRQDLGIENETIRFSEKVKEEAEIKAKSITLRYIKKLQVDGILTFNIAEKAIKEIWETN